MPFGRNFANIDSNGVENENKVCTREHPGGDLVGMSGQGRFGAGCVESTWVSLGSMG